MISPLYSHVGPFHHRVAVFNSAGDILLDKLSAGFSLIDEASAKICIELVSSILICRMGGNVSCVHVWERLFHSDNHSMLRVVGGRYISVSQRNFVNFLSSMCKVCCECIGLDWCCEWIELGWFTCTIESSALSWTPTVRNQRRFENVPVSKTKSQRCELSRKENDFVSQGNRAVRKKF
ncbi:unnamed protein product [Brugia pahangi]|uniref:RUN domain-containing protein n=1 Tax=Brugia pahangi TaxID=6280 RepID=A0A0N4TT74_BRUPA|nr:unnamed protein product [Brugia pahangi]